MTYDSAIDILTKHEYRVGRRIMITRNGEGVLMNLVVEVSPILIDDKISDIQKLLPDFVVLKSGTGVIHIQR